MTHRGAQTISIVVGLLSAGALAGILLFPTPLVFGIVIVVWLALLTALDRFLLVQQGRATALPISLLAAVALLGMLTTVEQRPLQWLLVVLTGIFFSLVWSNALFRRSGAGHTRKLIRRTSMMLWVFVAYGLVTSLYALAQFFPGIPFWLIAVLGGALLSVIAWMVWRMYVDLPFSRAVLWMVILALVMIEYMWVLYLLPFSFTTSGFLVVWVWYIIQLFVRFHLGHKGIVWKKQRWFLLTNLVMYVALLIFIIRWV